jgi:hypothetical protein
MSRMRWPSLAAAAALILSCSSQQASAQSSAPTHGAPADEGLRVALLTFSPGQHPFLAFGHNALWIHDPRMTGDDVDLVYNYGTFDFGSPGVVADFFRGTLRYWLSLATLAWTLENYGSEGRSVLAQELSLSFDEADRLERALLTAALPENRRYPYGYVRDNCSTRLRDAIDEATGGLLRASISGPGSRTFREQVAAMMADRPALGAALDVALGPAVDRPTERWDETFLPEGLASALRQISRPAGGGAAVSFVKREYPLRGTPGARTLPRPPPRGRARWLVAAGCLLGALAAALGAALGRGAAPGRARGALGAYVVLAGITMGAIGVILAVLLVTPGAAHPLLRGNTNVLQASPLALALAASGWRAWRPGRTPGRGAPALARALGLAAASLALSLAGLALALSGLAPQENGPFIAFALPLWAGLTLGLWVWWRAERGQGGGSPGPAQP